MNRNETRKKKSFERHHAAKIAKQCAAFCFDFDEIGCYVQITNPIAVETLRHAFEQHLLGQDDVTYMRLTDAQSKAFLKCAELAEGTVSVMAVTRDNHGDLAYAIERCSGGLGDEDELLEAGMRAAKLRLSFY